jgi:hypothetical protein
MTATDGKRWLYPEMAFEVARQNGKTGLLKVRIIMGLLRGEKIMMTAQDRQLIVRDVFNEVSDIAEQEFRSEIKGNGKARRANGQESIQMRNGGRFRIVAPTRGGARGPANDLVIIDEARELTDNDFIAGALPTLTVSRSPQIIYTSNAGTEDSVVLATLRKRAETDASLAYLAWSAQPDRPLDDRAGWMEANPALADGVNAEGHMRFLEAMYQKYTAEGHPEIFQTEHLCQWVDTEMPRVVPDIVWERARGPVGEPVRPSVGLAKDPAGRRVSVALAWRVGDKVHAYLLADIEGYPVDLEAASEKVLPVVKKLAAGKRVMYDPWTDNDWARHFPDAKKLMGQDWEAACRVFVEKMDAGELVVEDPDGRLTLDMAATVRRDTGHGWVAVRASDERSNTGALALIRAVWMATMPVVSGPRVW